MDATNKNKLLRTLAKLYGAARSELNFSGEYQLIVSVILSAQTTDKKVNEITPVLFSAFPSFSALGKTRPSEIGKIIRQVNYYKTKSKNLQAMAQRVVHNHHGKLPRIKDELTSLPGVGNKTANVVLCELGAAPAFPVDTHVFRVSKRLGLTQGETTDQVEKGLRSEFAPRHWRNLHHWLILHGRRVCKARKPLCPECALAPICAYYSTLREK
jgi:endonuclease III